MRKQRLEVNHEIPILESKRRCTDIACLIVPVLFFLFLVYSMIVYNSQYVRILSAPTDGQGVVCGVGAPDYPFLYVANPFNIGKRICVKNCPFNITKITGIRYNVQKGTNKLIATSAELQNEHPALATMNANKIYDSIPFDTMRGGFCLPNNLVLRQQLIINTSMTWWIGFLQNLSLVWTLCVLAIVVCGGYLALMLYFPKRMDILMPVIGGLFISTFGVNLIFYNIRFEIGFNRVMLGLFLFLFGALVLLCCWLYRKQLKAHGMFIEHAGRLLKSRMNMLVHIFIYVVLSFLLIAVSYYEFLAVWTTLAPTFSVYELFYRTHSYFSYFFTTIILIQVWWGLYFLKEAFNYTVSSIAADWYFNQKVTRGLFAPYFKIFRYHLGSIYYGSFVSALFEPISFLQSVTSPREFTIRADRACSSIWMPCIDFLNFVRPDSFVILDITGQSYKECVRYRNQLCEDLSLFRDIHVASRIFRIGSYGFICGFIGYIALYFRHNMVMSALTLLLFLLLVISMFFVGIYADVAEALNILFLADEYRLEGGALNVFQTPEGITEIKNPHHKAIEDLQNPMNRPIYNPINQQLARQGNSQINLGGMGEIAPDSRISRNYNPSTYSQRVENQLGYNFKNLAETSIR